MKNLLKYFFALSVLFACDSDDEDTSESIISEVGENKVLLEDEELNLSSSATLYDFGELTVENLGTLYNYEFEFSAGGNDFFVDCFSKGGGMFNPGSFDVIAPNVLPTRLRNIASVGIIDFDEDDDAESGTVVVKELEGTNSFSVSFDVKLESGKTFKGNFSGKISNFRDLTDSN